MNCFFSAYKQHDLRDYAVKLLCSFYNIPKPFVEILKTKPKKRQMHVHRSVNLGVEYNFVLMYENSNIMIRFHRKRTNHISIFMKHSNDDECSFDLQHDDYILIFLMHYFEDKIGEFMFSKKYMNNKYNNVLKFTTECVNHCKPTIVSANLCKDEILTFYHMPRKSFRFY